MNNFPTKTEHGRLTWALIVVLIVRSLIPIGYMPDFSKQAETFPSMMICGGHMHQHNDPTQAKNDAPCPFSINATFSFAGVQEPAFASLISFFIILLIPATLSLTLRRTFGNASSRAPPAVLA